MKCRRRSLYVSLLVCLLPVTSHSAQSGEENAIPWRVLLVYSYGRDFAPFDAVATEFRTELPKTMVGKVLRRALRDGQP